LGANKRCFRQLYGQEFNPNSVVEVMGVYTLDPLQADTDDEVPLIGFAEESRARNIPTSRVPRIHAISAVELAHLNPHLPQAIAGACGVLGSPKGRP
jgi:hypothetical protein